MVQLTSACDGHEEQERRARSVQYERRAKTVVEPVGSLLTHADEKGEQDGLRVMHHLDFCWTHADGREHGRADGELRPGDVAAESR